MVELFTGAWVSWCWVDDELTQERAELICQGATPQKTGIFLRGGFNFLLEGKWADHESQKGMVQDKGGISMSRCSALKNEHLPKRKDLIFLPEGE